MRCRKGALVAICRIGLDGFIDTSETLVGARFRITMRRYVAPGSPVELTFTSFWPGTSHRKLETVFCRHLDGAALTSGVAVTPKAIDSDAFRGARERVTISNY